MPINHGSKFNELSDHQYTLIGKIIVEFSNVDTLLGILLTRLLLSPDFLGRTYTDQLSHNNTVAAKKNALEVHSKRYNNFFISEKKSDNIKAILQRVKDLNDTRNKFAHYNFGRFIGETIFSTKFSGKPPNEQGEKTDHVIFTDDDLLKMYNKSYEIVETLKLITESIRDIDETFLLNEARKLKPHKEPSPLKGTVYHVPGSGPII
jgi:hypothetical protein